MCNLTARKTTKNNLSVTQSVKDCFALNMFCNGDDAFQGDVFDKFKNKVTNYSKVQWSNYGHQFNHFSRERESARKNASQYKLVKALEKSVTDLLSKNSSLKEENDKNEEFS